MDKRGQGLSVNAIILIILGIVVLAVLILGFTIGWAKIVPWISSNNVQSITTQCEVACSTGSTYDYCTQTRELNNGTGKITNSCNEFANNATYVAYGIAKCPEITCI